METLWVGRGTSTLDTSKPFLATRTLGAAMEDVTSNGCCLLALTILPGIGLTERGDEVEVEGGGVLTETKMETLGLPTMPMRRGVRIPGAEPKAAGLKIRYATYGPKAGGRKTRRARSGKRTARSRRSRLGRRTRL